MGEEVAGVGHESSRAHSARVSPSFCPPPGKLQRPRFGGLPRLAMRTSTPEEDEEAAPPPAAAAAASAGRREASAAAAAAGRRTTAPTPTRTVAGYSRGGPSPSSAAAADEEPAAVTIRGVVLPAAVAPPAAVAGTQRNGRGRNAAGERDGRAGRQRRDAGAARARRGAELLDWSSSWPHSKFRVSTRWFLPLVAHLNFHVPHLSATRQSLHFSCDARENSRSPCSSLRANKYSSAWH